MAFNRRYLKPEEVNRDWWQWFAFNQQEVRGGHLCVLATCPACGDGHWVLASHARHRGQSPYCYQHRSLPISLGRRKPLLPEEIAPKWRGYYDFARQEVRGRPDSRRGLEIWATCPVCGKERWQKVKNIRAHHLTPRCHLCAVSGPQAYQWAGGRYTTDEGYIHVHLAGLPPAERALAESMADHQDYVREHRLVMAKHLGRPLSKDEIVHHSNGIKDDNRLENLRLLKIGQHHAGHGDPYCQQLQEALAKIRQLENELAQRDGVA